MIGMTEEQITRYLQLASRKTFILLHSGTDWKPEYASELMAIDQELTELMKVKEQAHAQREQISAEATKIPRDGHDQGGSSRNRPVLRLPPETLYTESHCVYSCRSKATDQF